MTTTAQQSWWVGLSDAEFSAAAKREVERMEHAKDLQFFARGRPTPTPNRHRARDEQERAS